jgi:hypothetical protein
MSAGTAPFSLVVGRTPVAAVCHGALGSTSTGEKAWVGIGLEGRGLGERLGAPEVLIYRTGEEIVAGDRGAYPKKFGKWRDTLNRTVAGSFGIQAESYSV